MNKPEIEDAVFEEVTNVSTTDNVEVTEPSVPTDYFTQKALQAAEEDFEMTPEEIKYNQQLIAQLAKIIEMQHNARSNNRKVKAKRRAANKVQRASRRTNRKG